MLILNQLKKDLQKLANPAKAKILARFFKTGPGEYGEGDVFLGLTVPQVRQVVKNYQDLGFRDISKLLKSPIHEHRLVALLILVHQYQRGDDFEKKKIFNLYLANASRVNNWDLVDLTAPHLVGKFLLDKDRAILYQLAKSGSLWKRRISIMATFSFIRNDQFEDTLKIAAILLHDEHDLIHKAVGWMLRELGKRNQALEEEFLKKNLTQMPRTMLRYAIEKFPESKRKAYLRKT